MTVFHAQRSQRQFSPVEFVRNQHLTPTHHSAADSLPEEIQAFKIIILINSFMLLNREHNFKISISFGS